MERAISMTYKMMHYPSGWVISKASRRMAGEEIWVWVVLGDVLVMIYVIRHSGRDCTV